MITVKTCYEITCDNCGPKMYDDSDYGILHYDSEAEALAQVVPCDGDDRNTLTLHRRGDRVLCTNCAHEGDCARDGHRWDDWLPPYNGHEYRSCSHCGHGEFRPPLAIGGE